MEAIHQLRTNTGVPIRDKINLAIKTTKDAEVRRYLTRAMKYYKGNAAGTTKFAALWLAVQVRRARPELWSLAGLSAPDPPREGGSTPPPPEDPMEEEGVV